MAGMHNLTTLIKRLEAATSRLEDIASTSTEPPQPDPQSNGDSGLQAPLGGAGRASSSAPNLAHLPAPHSQATAKAAAEELPPAIREFDALLDKERRAFLDAGKVLDPLIAEQSMYVGNALRDERKFLLVATKAKKPDLGSQTFADLVKDLQQDMSSVGDVREHNRGSPLKDHLAMVGEGITGLQWLVMDGKPADFVGEVIGGVQMYGNRVLKAYKDTDQAHVKYVQAYYTLLKAIQSYINKHYPNGVTWNPNGIDAAQAWHEVNESTKPTTNARSTPSGGPPPPPPPPPPLPNFDNAPPPPPMPAGGERNSQGGDMDAVFAALNQGENVTKGLKKVDKSQMTHKNPALRAQGSVPDRKGSDDSLNRSRSRGPETKPKPPSMRQTSTATQKPATPAAGKKELDGNKWLIENWDGPSQPIEIEVSLTQSILISRCKNTTIILRGKANAISIDNSPRTQILVESLVSAVDVIKCANFALQVTGTLPTIMLDQVDGASIYLGAASLGTEVFTSKCSSVNIVLPPESESESEDSKECPLPEQIRTFIQDGRLVSEIVEHAG